MSSRPDTNLFNSEDPIRDVANCIRGGRVTSHSERKDFIYLFHVTLRDSGKVVYKIGRTSETLKSRGTRIIKACRHESMQPVDHLSYQHTKNAVMVEKLFKIEFKQYRGEVGCDCKVQQHTEYFDISSDAAVEAFTRWRSFCATMEPWIRETKMLWWFWDDRLERWEHAMAEAAPRDQKEIAAYWRRFTQPVWWDWLWFSFWTHCYVLAFLCWLLWSLFQDTNMMAQALFIFRTIVGVTAIELFRFCCSCNTIQPFIHGIARKVCTFPDSGCVSDDSSTSIQEPRVGLGAAGSRLDGDFGPDFEVLGERVLTASERSLRSMFVVDRDV